jgi:hypothetical protein
MQGGPITLRRVTGTARIPFDVTVQAFVGSGGGAQPLIGAVQIAGDKVTMTNREILAAKWPAPPRHGDILIYQDGTTVVVQGRAAAYTLAEDTVYVLQVLG